MRYVNPYMRKYAAGNGTTQQPAKPDDIPVNKNVTPPPQAPETDNAPAPVEQPQQPQQPQPPAQQPPANPPAADTPQAPATPPEKEPTGQELPPHYEEGGRFRGGETPTEKPLGEQPLDELPREAEPDHIVEIDPTTGESVSKPNPNKQQLDPNKKAAQDNANKPEYQTDIAKWFTDFKFEDPSSWIPRLLAAVVGGMVLGNGGKNPMGMLAGGLLGWGAGGGLHQNWDQLFGGNTNGGNTNGGNTKGGTPIETTMTNEQVLAFNKAMQTGMLTGDPVVDKAVYLERQKKLAEYKQKAGLDTANHGSRFWRFDTDAENEYDDQQDAFDAYEKRYNRYYK